VNLRGPLAAAVFLVVSLSAAAQDWTQWGGPNRNFTSPATGLASSWPAGGPRAIWSRNLGEGYSGIVAEGNRIYTMYRDTRSNQEVATALDAGDGRTVWEHRYAAPILRGINAEYGPGPHATPLIVGDLVVVAGAMGHFYALDKVSGKPRWSHNLNTEFSVLWERGYSCSPIAYGESIILTTGRPGQSVIAFNRTDGRVLWKKHSMPEGPSSPLLIKVDGQDQLVLFMADGPAGIDPANGDLLWTGSHRTDYGLNISTPVWGSDNLLFVSSAYNGGSRAFQLQRQGGKTSAKQLWASNRMRVHFGSAIRLNDYVYGSSGDFGPAFLSAINIRTGQVAWQDRSFARASLIYADGKFIVLDEEGMLGLATMTPQGMKVLARAEILASNSWTAPTLVGTRLYVRDRKTIRALDLS
jgi:outer membrane protein assembly factor BamB